MAATQATKDLGEDMGTNFTHTDEVIDKRGNTGTVYGKEVNGKVQVVYHSTGEKKVRRTIHLEINDYANSDEEEGRSMDSGEVDPNYGIEFDESLARLRELAGLTEDQSINYLMIAKQLKQQIENSGRSFQTQINQHLIDDLRDAGVTDEESAVEWYEGWIADGEYGIGQPDLEIIIAYNGHDYDVTAPGAEYSDMTELGHFDFDQAKLAAREARSRLQDEGHKVKITLRK
jgi:transcriptional regulator with XRE-family HTH domain